MRGSRVLRLSGLGFLLPLLLVLRSPAAEEPAEDAAYVRVTNERAAKIVAALDLDDPGSAARVTGIIARHYRDLQRLHDERDAAVAAAAGQGDADARLARAESGLKVRDLHFAFLGRLAAELTPAQVDQVKDGMTYGVLPLTYQVYQDMVPTLTDEQKRQILAWLTEAREHAMDGGSSEEKHRWFGKYKGRINNHLAAAGIDLKQAEHDMRERRKRKPQMATDEP